MRIRNGEMVLIVAVDFCLWTSMLGFTCGMWGGALVYCPCLNYELYLWEFL
jgi:hypothetical protein